MNAHDVQFFESAAELRARAGSVFDQQHELAEQQGRPSVCHDTCALINRKALPKSVLPRVFIAY